MYIIGIDPGKNGGIVALTNGKVTDITPMPSTIRGIWDHFIYLGFPNMIKKEDTYVFIEDVHSMPTDGRKSAFSFGYHVGILHATLDHFAPYYRTVRPRDWMLTFEITKQKEESSYNYKKRLLELGRSLCDKRTDKVISRLTLKTVDAYLIALYAYNQLKKEK